MTSRTSDLPFVVTNVSTVPTSTIGEALDSENHVSWPHYLSAARVGPYIYVSGRLGVCRKDVGHRFASVVAVLNVKSMAWHWIPSEGYREKGSTLFLYMDYLYGVGLQKHSKSPSPKNANLARFDLALEEWCNVHAVGEGPGDITCCSGDLLEQFDCYAVFGGLYKEQDSNVYLLDVPAMRWSKGLAKGTPAVSRYYHGSCVLNGLIYIYGGIRLGSRLKDLHIVKVSRERVVTWSSPRTKVVGNIPRSSFFFCPLGRIIFICGGYEDGDRKATLAYFDADKGEFHEIEYHGSPSRLFKGSYGACGTYIENGRSIVVIGGDSDVTKAIRIELK